MVFFDDLEILLCGRSEKNSGAYTDHYFDGYYGLQFISEGKITLSVNGSVPVTAHAPVSFFTCPGAAFSYSSPPGETRGHSFICFKGPRTERYLNGGLLPQTPEAKFYPVTDTKAYNQLWRQLLICSRRSGKASQAETVLLLEKLLVTTILSTGQTGKSRLFDRDLLTALAVRIADNPGENWDFCREAEQIGISMVHFRRLFQEATGMPLWQYVIACRIKHAAQLLVSTDKLVKEIANDCGFNSVFHFSREFKKIMKKSPDNFRKNI